jgi:hypothetical protein
MKVMATVELSGSHAITHRRFEKEVDGYAAAEAWVKALAESAERQGHRLVSAVVA